MPFNSAKLAITLMVSANIKGFEGKMKQLERSMKGTLARANKIGHQMEKAGANLTKAGTSNVLGGAAILAPLALITKKAVDLESATEDIAKVLPDTIKVGSKGFLQLEKSAMRVGSALGRTAEDSAGLMAALAAGGVAQKSLERTALLAGKIGVAFDVTGLEAGQSFQAIRNAMQLSEKQAMQVMDANNALANSYGSTVDASARLLKFMKDTGASVAAALHVSGGDIQALANSFMTIGIDSDTAGTTIDRFSKSILTSAKAAAIFKKAGGGTAGFMAILGKAKQSGNAVQWLLNNKIAGMYATQLGAVANAMDSDKGLRAQLAFVNNQKNVQGSVNQEFANKASTRKFQLEKFKSDALSTAAALGNSLLPVLENLLKAITPIINRISTWIEKNPKLVGYILKTVAAFGALKIGIGALQLVFGGALGVMGKMVTNSTLLFQVLKGGKTLAEVFPNIAKGIKIVGGAFKVVSKLFMANPWLIAIMAIAAGVYLIIKNWSKIKAFFIRLWAWVKKVFMQAWEFIKNIFLNYTPEGLVIKNWSKIADFFVGLWDSIKRGFMKFVGWFTSKWDWLNEHVFQPVRHLFGGSSSTVNVNHINTPEPAPKLLPNRSGGVNAPFNMTVNLTGGATKKDADMFGKAAQAAFKKHYDLMQHNKNRISLAN